MSYSILLARQFAKFAVPKAGIRAAVQHARHLASLAIVTLAILLLSTSINRCAAQTRLNPPLARGDAVIQFEVSPDGRWLAMEIGQTRISDLLDNPTHDGLSEVFVARLSDGSLNSLGIDVGLGGLFTKSAFDRGSTHVIASTPDHGSGPHRAILGVLETGSTLDLSSRIGNDTILADMEFVPGFSPERDRLIWQSSMYLEEERRFAYPLYSLDAYGRDALSLSDGLRGISPLDTSVASAGNRDFAVFSAVRDDNPNNWRIYRADLATGERETLTPQLASSDSYSPLLPSWRVTNDTQQIVYSATQLTPGVTELFVIPTAGGQPRRLSIPASVDRHVEKFELAGDHVVYAFGKLADIRPTAYSALYSVPVSGGSSRELFISDPGQSSDRVTDFIVSPDGDRVIIRQVVNGLASMRSIAIDGTGSRELVSLPGNTTVYRLGFSSDADRLVYRVDRGLNREWFTARANGEEISSLTDDLPETFEIPSRTRTTPQFTADNREVLLHLRDHRNSPAESGLQELYMIPVGGGEPIRVNEDLVQNGGVADFTLTPDGSTVVYASYQRSPYVQELFAAPLRLHWSRDHVGNWNVAENWGPNADETNQFTPMRATSVVIDMGGEVTIPSTAGRVNIARLTLGSDLPSQSVLRFGEDGGEISVARDAAIRPAGRLSLSRGALTAKGHLVNEGVIDVIDAPTAGFGSGRLQAERLLNFSTGNIFVAEENTLTVRSDMYNEGHITLAPSAIIYVSGDWEGRGTEGGGKVVIRGNVSPGIGIGEQTFGDNLILEPSPRASDRRVSIEIAGTRAGREHDVLRTGGALTVGGRLDVSLVTEGSAMYAPSIGDGFTIIEAQGGIEGHFSSVAVPSPDWAIGYNETTISLRVLDPAGRGDYNGDGRIDQADLDLVLTLDWGVEPSVDRPLLPEWTNYLPIGSVDQAELHAVLLGWGRNVVDHGTAFIGTIGPPVPEPPTVWSFSALLVVGAAARFRTRRGCCRPMPSSVACGFGCLLLITFDRSSKAQVQLNPPLARGDAVTQFAISPDGRWVAIEVGQSRTSRNMDNQTNDGLSEVLVRRMGGGDWTSLGVARRLEMGFGVTRFDPGSAYLVTRTEHDWMSYLDSDVRLHSLATGESWDVSAGLPADRGFVRLTFPPAFGPEHGYVVLSTQTYSQELQRYDDALYSVNAFDGSTLSLMDVLYYAQAFDIEAASLTDADFVFFMAVTVPDPSDYRVYQTDLATGARTSVYLPPAAGEIDAWSAGGFRLSDDAETIVVSAYPYFADQDDYGPGQLYAVPTTAGQPLLVGNPIATTHRLADFTVLGNDYVLYGVSESGTRPESNGYLGLYSATLSGSAVHELYTPDPVDADARLSSYSVTPDGTWVLTQERSNGRIHLRSVQIDGGDANVVVTQPEHGVIVGPWFSDNSERMVYRTGRGSNEEWFTARIDGTEVTSLTAGVENEYEISSSVGRPLFVADGQEVLLSLRSLPSTPVSRDLVMFPVAGGEPIRINDELVEGGNVRHFIVTPDGSTVLYTATAHDRRVEELFAAPLRLHWSGNQVGLWNVAGNWGPNSDEISQFTPMQVTSVVIDAGGEVAVPPTVGRVNIARLTVGGEGSSESILRTGEGGIRMSVARDAVIRPTGRLVLEGGTLGVEGDFTNEGIIDVAGGGEISGGRIQNAASGSILIAHDERLSYSGGHIFNAGHITLTPSATLQASGTWEGRGTHGAGQVIVRGELWPGIGIGEQSFGGDLVLEAAPPEAESSILIEIAGTRAGREHDLLRAGGTFTFSGHLDVRLLDNGSGAFEPSVGHDFTIIEAQGGLDGRFTSFAMPSSSWAIHYDETTIRLEVLDPAGRGDYNGDGRIDQADLDVALLSWGDAPSDHRLPAQWTHYVPVGLIGQAELDSVLLGWGRFHQPRSISEPRATRSTPEPSAMPLAMLAAITAAFYGRRVGAR